MKRSEMVQLMEDAMIEWQDSYAKFGGKWSAMFSFILEQQENAGMKPPGKWSSVLRGDTAQGEIERVQWHKEVDE